MEFVKQNIRSFSMILALLIIWIFFSFLTDGVFLDARNLSNLVRQMAVISCLAVGMTLIIISGNIDLSVGSVVGVTGAVAAMIQVKWIGPMLFENFADIDFSILSHWVTIIAIILTLTFGALIGLFQGLWVAYGKVPSFIVTLAGMLIFRGMILGITDGVTIGPTEPSFKALGQAYLPQFWGWTVTLLTLILVFIILWNQRIKSRKYHLPTTSTTMFAIKICLIVFAATLFLWSMNNYKGVPTPVVILLIIVAIASFISNNTTLGRYIYAIGGNQEAARLSGINISKVLLINFIIMGVLAAVSGIILTARLDAATNNAGNMFELSAIAACVIGGCSLAGGQGGVLGALIGALIMASLDNGMSLMNVEIFWQQIIKGLVLLLAVWLDVYSKSTTGGLLRRS